MSLPLRVGLIGAGMVAGKHLPAYRTYGEKVCLGAVCDVNLAAGQKRAGQAGVSAVFDDPMGMIRQAAIDAVDICTSHDQHAALAIAAAQAGKHVLMEKPLGCTPAECRAVVDAAKANGVTLMVGMNHRFHPHYRAILKSINAGDLGLLSNVGLTAELNVAGAPADHWVFDGKRAGGGVIMSLGVQQVDLARYLVDEIRRVGVELGTADARFRNGAESDATAVVEFSCGMRGVIDVKYVFEPSLLSQTVMLGGDSGDVCFMQAPGERTASPVLTTNRIAGPREPRMRQLCGDYTGLAGDDTFANQILHFAECCQTGRMPLGSGDEAIKTMAVVFAMYQSVRTGEMVEVGG